jgi:hypothetical protein
MIEFDRHAPGHWQELREVERSNRPSARSSANSLASSLLSSPLAVGNAWPPRRAGSWGQRARDPGDLAPPCCHPRNQPISPRRWRRSCLVVRAAVGPAQLRAVAIGSAARRLQMSPSTLDERQNPLDHRARASSEPWPRNCGPRAARRNPCRRTQAPLANRQHVQIANLPATINLVCNTPRYRRRGSLSGSRAECQHHGSREGSRDRRRRSPA